MSKVLDLHMEYHRAARYARLPTTLICSLTFLIPFFFLTFPVFVFVWGNALDGGNSVNI